MFIATVDQCPIPDSERMSHLETLLTIMAKSAISGGAIPDSSMMLHGAFWRGSLEGLM